MRLRLFRRENSGIAQRQRQEDLERMLAEGLRAASSLLDRMAQLIERQRLDRAGYAPQERFLERTDDPKKQD